ncbi:zinc finger protein 704-like isoform X2 [Belonocnema kinseyi]|uniref:zinc finger protein 704-like isoform X2 n=1 Tax=Belonocnema kinseyi TaxID=2817044 RepID=UPI00143D4D2D|nr:zinc finger protein 704-like isoform X2 [Belonocnema kinseyi]
MSTGKRLAKRSIFGTKVCAPLENGKYYCGSIFEVHTPGSNASGNGMPLTTKTRFLVKFDDVPGEDIVKLKEYQDREIIGPGFGSITNTKLVPGQKVYLTYNGREIHAEVTEHNVKTDEVHVVFAPSGQESMSLVKKLDEVRLLESRKSARLSNSDTNFAKLADVNSDRKRSTSTNSTEVLPPNGDRADESIARPRGPKTKTERLISKVEKVRKLHEKRNRKRRTSSGTDSERNYDYNVEIHVCHKETGSCHIEQTGICEEDAAKWLISLSQGRAQTTCTNIQKPLPMQGDGNYSSWRVHENGVVGSPGVGGASSSSSSGGSWRTGTPSPPIYEDARSNNANTWSKQVHTAEHSPKRYVPGVTPDEGIVSDYMELDDVNPRKKKVRSKPTRDLIESNPNSENTTSNENGRKAYKCAWRNCNTVRFKADQIEQHVREVHLSQRMHKLSPHEEDFYFQEIDINLVGSLPTLSHRDMARPPHEDPEYLKQFHVEAIPASIYAENALRGDPNPFSISPETAKHLKLASRSFHTLQHNVGLLTLSTDKLSSRRNRGETKKCRKVYGMDQRQLWCTQCRWKKACTRFND